MTSQYHHHTTTISQPFFRDHPGQPVSEENFWPLWCKGRSTEADTPTIRLGASPSGLMLRSIQVVKSCSRDHVILVITSSRLANGTHFNADRQFRQT